MANKSIVEYFAEHEKYKCGYCGAKDTNYSHGMWCHFLTVQDYQDLIDRGWRRSGCYSYKPTMNQTCCPQYTIKCEALNYKLTKSQKKVIKKVNNYLNYGKLPQEKKSPNTSNEESGCAGEMSNYRESTGEKVTLDQDQNSGNKKTHSENTETSNKFDEQDMESDGKTSTTSKSDSKVTEHIKKQVKPGEGADPNKPPCRKAKEIRRQKWAEKHGQPLEDSRKQKKLKNEGKCLEDFLFETVPNPVHKLEVRLVRSTPRSRAFEESFMEAYKVYQTYQMSIHKDTPEDCDMKGYKNFLVDSPLKEESEDNQEDDVWQGYGSFHHQYILDGKIIAVGVIDVLPYCTSSVYLFYDPDYSFLSLGTYSALREVALTRQLHQQQASIKYYYMGFYIQSCPKMKYKGNFGPAYILCPKSYTWHPIKECAPKLDQNKYCEFSSHEEDPVKADSVLILYQRQAMPYMMYKILSQQEDGQDRGDAEEIEQYANFVGHKCAKRMLLYRKAVM